MDKKFYIRRFILILLLPLGALMFYSAPHAGHFIENVYSNGLFKLFSQALSLLTGLIPVSLAEIGLILLPLVIIAYLVFHIYRFVSQKRNKKHVLIRFFLNTAAIVSVIYFFFVFFWSLNYSRLPFSEIAGLDIKPASVNELAEVCEKLIHRANEERLSVAEDNKGVMMLKDGYKEALKRAYKGYDKAVFLFPELGGKYGAPKGVLLSRYMSYTGISGVYCPFTAEANVDVDMPDMLIPSTAAHEMAHQRGFAREDEANYIAYITCKLHPDPDYRYSGTMLALIYSMNTLYKYDKDKYFQLAELYGQGLIRDNQDNSQYWKRFEGPVERTTDSLNNSYLKANMQKDGVQSYGRMVDLLIAEHRAEKGQ